MEHLEHGERGRNFFLQPWSPPPPPPPLPPPLPSRARIDGSGTRAVGDPARRDAARPIDQTPGVTAADRPAGAGPPGREEAGPPAEHGRRKHSAGGLESVLSGSEEDVHLETVNTFFERHGRPAGPEEPPEPGPEGLEARGEVTLETEPRRGGPRAGDGDSPETVAALHSPTAGSEAALGTDATQTAGGNVDINTMNKAGADLDTTPEGADGSSRVETNKLTNPETESLNKEDRPMTTATHELRQCSGDRGPSDDFICLENTLGSGRALTSETCKRWRDAEYGQPSLNMETLCRIVGAVVEEKLQQVNINLLLPGLDPDSPKRSAGKDRPQSDYSRRRKKKRKKRCSSLLEKSEHRGQFSAEPKEWQHAQRSGMDPRLAKNRGEVRVSDVHGPDCTDVTQTSSFIENPSDNIHPQHPPVPDNADRLASSAASHSGGQCNALHSPPANTGKSISTRCQADDSRAPAAADGGNVAARSQARGPPQQNESTGSTLTRRSMTPASACERSFLSGDEEDADHVRTLHEKKHSPASRSCQSGGKSHFHAAEVSATINGASRGGDSNDPTREANQNDKGANTEQSELAAETGFPGRDNPTECPRPPQHSQKLEIDCHKAVQLSSSYLTGAPIVVIGSDTKGLTQESQIELNNCSGVINNPVDGHFDLDFSEVSLDAESTAPNSQHVTMPELTVFSGETSSEGIQPPEPHITTVQLTDTRSFQSEEISSTSSISLDGLPNNNESISTNTPKLTQSYGDLCNAEPPKHEGNIVVEKSDHAPQIVDTDKRVKAIKEVERQEASQGPSELQCQIEGPDPTSETGDAVSIGPDSKNKVFAMSSFWNEMERLTIKDILGLRTPSVTTPPLSLSPLVEIEEADNTDTDSGYFTPRLDDTKAVSAIPALEPAKVNSAASIHDDASFRSLDVMWDGEPSPVSLGGGIYPENMTSDTDNPQPPLTTSSEERCRRQMLKNTSVHNLRAMDSELFRQTRKVQTLAAVIPEESESERERFPDVQKPCCDSGGDSMSSSLLTEGTPAESYRISLTDIFQCLFGGKQSDPKPPDSGDAGTYCISGNTVPETYDQFFSEFDCGSFFYPLTAAEDRPKDQLVPIFSRSRSVSRYLQYPEAYDHFLSSSSSDDDSSTESEVDDPGEVLGPIRVVTRSSRGTAEAPTSTDIYENFFTDLDLRQNFFWKPTFSLRNVSLIGPASQRQRRCGPLAPADPGSLQKRCRAFPSLNALDSQGPLDPGPVLYHYEERIYRNLQPFSFEDLQSAVSEQSLGASLVPLRQSDMCLVCIAFASWVLKSANPHVGDAWKAVLLANVSALSAIGYLRKYMRDRSVDQPAASRATL